MAMNSKQASCTGCARRVFKFLFKYVVAAQNYSTSCLNYSAINPFIVTVKFSQF